MFAFRMTTSSQFAYSGSFWFSYYFMKPCGRELP